MRFAIEPVSRKLPANVALSAITCHTNAGIGQPGPSGHDDKRLLVRRTVTLPGSCGKHVKVTNG